MLRPEKEITDPAALADIIRRAQVCHLGMCKDNQPYVVPLNFGYEDGALYMHCAQVGMKLDFLCANDRVCFELEVDAALVTGPGPCECSMKYRSVIGFGKANIIDDVDEKRKVLDIIMRHYVEAETYEYAEKALQKTVIIKVEISSMTGKQSKYP